MLRDKHKRKINHVVLVTSDATDTKIKQFRITSRFLWVVILVLCIVIGAMLGYIAYEEKIWAAVDARSDEQTSEIKRLEGENEQLRADKLGLETEIAGLNETVQILSETVSQKTQSEAQLQMQLEEQSMPIGLPLDGSASIEEFLGEEPIYVFTAAVGTAVVSTAIGKVTGVNSDVDYGHNVWVDHGNGYVTIYRNEGTPKVEQGDSVARGTPLFEIEEGHEKLGYQMMKDGVYIDPEEMLDISG